MVPFGVRRSMIAQVDDTAARRVGGQRSTYGIAAGIGLPPPGIDSAKSSKQITYHICDLQDPESKGDDLQDLANAGVMVLLEL
jgi:hypothetical protein